LTCGSRREEEEKERRGKTCSTKGPGLRVGETEQQLYIGRRNWSLQADSCKRRARHAEEREREREREMWIAGCLLVKDLPKFSARK
jgi:hypothetical protein